MTQEELIQKYREVSEANDIDYSSPSAYFKSARKHFAPLQDGVADENNYFENTIALYEECEKPEGEPDYISGSGSKYWYRPNGVIRGADHWGCRVANCDWAIHRYNGRTVYGQSPWALQVFGSEFYGYAEWTNFIQKTKLYEINGKEVVTTFRNSTGTDIVFVDGKPYRHSMVIVWEEAEI